MGTLVSPSLQALITSARNLLNQPDPNNSFWSDEELSAYANEGVRVYFAELVNINEGHFTAQTDLTITNGSELVTLPSDFLEVRALYKKVSNGYIILPYRNNLTEGYSTEGGTGSETYLPYYYFRGNSLVLRPIPQFTEVAGLRMEYIQFPDTLVNGGDALTSQISPVFKQIVEMYIVYKAKVKESLVMGSDTTTIAAQNLSELTKQFKDVVAIRSKNPTAVIPFNPESEGF